MWKFTIVIISTYIALIILTANIASSQEGSKVGGEPKPGEVWK
jgi:hypothetical protein